MLRRSIPDPLIDIAFTVTPLSRPGVRRCSFDSPHEHLGQNGSVTTIRSATTEDIGDVVDLWEGAAGPSRQPGRHDEVYRLIAHDPDSLLIAEHDGCILGTVIIGWDGWRCHLYRLAVDQSVRRSGIARALMDQASLQAKALGASRLDAMVNVENDQAIAFWEQFGFEFDPDDGRWSMII